MDKPFFPPTGKQVVPLSKLQDEDEPTIISQPRPVGSGRDELFEDALRICVKKQSASASILQQHLRIRPERAAALLKALERAGFVGKANGAKPRRVRGIAYATVLRWDKNK